MVDIEEFKRLQWALLRNVKMKWEYDGIAYLFREANIPIYGKPLGSMKENHPYLSVMVPKRRNENYGVDIYVPVDRLREAKRLIQSEDALKKAADLENRYGEQAHEAFKKKAIENRELQRKKRKKSRHKAINKLLFIKSVRQ